MRTVGDEAVADIAIVVAGRWPWPREDRPELVASITSRSSCASRVEISETHSQPPNSAPIISRKLHHKSSPVFALLTPLLPAPASPPPPPPAFPHASASIPATASTTLTDSLQLPPPPSQTAPSTRRRRIHSSLEYALSPPLPRRVLASAAPLPPAALHPAVAAEKIVAPSRV